MNHSRIKIFKVSNLVVAVRNSSSRNSRLSTLTLPIPATTTDYRRFSSSTSSSSSTNNKTRIKAAAAVIRYDNNCATIPFVGCYDEAHKLKEQMEANTHKHHIYLIEGKFKTTKPPLGPYPSLDEAKKALFGRYEEILETENENFANGDVEK